LQRPWLGTIDIILALKRQPLPGSRKPVLRSDCRLRRISPTRPRGNGRSFTYRTTILNDPPDWLALALFLGLVDIAAIRYRCLD